MARINATISDELEARFRAEVGKRLGERKGNLSTAVEEAFEDWIRKGERR